MRDFPDNEIFAWCRKYFAAHPQPLKYGYYWAASCDVTKGLVVIRVMPPPKDWSGDSSEACVMDTTTGKIHCLAQYTRGHESGGEQMCIGPAVSFPRDAPACLTNYRGFSG